MQDDQRPLVHTHILIGGPADGTRQAVDSSLVLLKAQSDGGVITYRREIMAGETFDFTFWRWEGISVDEAIQFLLIGYAGAKLPREQSTG